MEKRNLPVITEEKVVNKIFTLRGVKVMLDKDLAYMYGVRPIRLREQVKRNIDRFPENFKFQLTGEEVEILVSQNAIASRRQLGGALPYAFTEHGVLMLACVLKSSQAINTSIRIIEVFVRLREMLFTNKEIQEKLDNLEQQVTRNNDDIAIIFDALRQLLTKPKPSVRPVGYRRKDQQ